MKKLLVLALSAAAFSQAGAAVMLTVADFSATTSRFIFTSFDGSNPQTQGINTQVGPISATFGTTNFKAFCVDINNDPALNTSYTVAPTTESTLGSRGGRIAWLYTTYVGAATTQDAGAALQLAIWDVLQDGGDGFTAGSLRAYQSSSNGATFTLANSYLAASVGKTATATVYTPTQNVGGFPPQTLIGPATAVPEPASIAGLGLATLALVRRRRRK